MGLRCRRGQREVITSVGLSDDAKEGIAVLFARRAPQCKAR
jgi:hypothetical protein